MIYFTRKAVFKILLYKAGLEIWLIYIKHILDDCGKRNTLSLFTFKRRQSCRSIG